MKQTRKLVYQVTASNGREVFKFGEYTFRYDRNLKPIPVQVDSQTADLLLEMMSSNCRCHRRIPTHLFREIM